MSDINTYMKHYSSAMNGRSNEQIVKSKEVQGRVMRTLEQKVRMDKVMNRYSNKFSSN